MTLAPTLPRREVSDEAEQPQRNGTRKLNGETHAGDSPVIRAYEAGRDTTTTSASPPTLRLFFISLRARPPDSSVRNREAAGTPTLAVSPRDSFAALDTQDSADMARLAQGDDDALERLMRRHEPWLLRRLAQMLHDPIEARDVIQKTFASVYAHRLSFRTDGKFHTWLATIAFNFARNELRRRHRLPEIVPFGDGVCDEDSDESEHALIEPSSTPAEALLRDEWLTALQTTLDEMPPKLRWPLERFAFEDCSQAAIAAELGCSVKAVETRLYRARQWVRASLEACARNSEGFRLPKRKTGELSCRQLAREHGEPLKPK